MWMMGCSDNGGLNISDSPFNGRKLRPLIPRPTNSSSSSSTTTTTTNATHPCLNLIHTSDLFMLNHHLATVSEQSKRDFNAQTVVSSRWNPTPEQLQTLEELYRCGTRTPTADQIQQITAQLRRFGKIEGKNVFYWFQNHKARERQKRRRQAESTTEQQQQQQQQQLQREIENFENKELDFQVEQAKRWALPTNSRTLSEEAVSMQRAGRAVIAESRTDGWIQFGERELQQRRRSVESHATWQMMQLSCSSPSTHLINNTSSAITTTIGRTTMNPMLTNTQNPIRESESQTLQLFPLRSEDVEEKEKELPISSKNNNCTPYQYFEFL